MMEFSQKIVITGVIMPNNWDENGRIIEIALYTNTEEVYCVEHNSLTRDLMDLMHKRVEIKGKIREQSGGIKSIAVKNFIVLKETIDDSN
ncbi:MAG: hypothetical protein KJN62_05890 [Deltaproteobacteria bacterium]|nr:hypothetical protein [Deltaproteobacteria bacterium]